MFSKDHFFIFGVMFTSRRRFRPLGGFKRRYNAVKSYGRRRTRAPFSRVRRGFASRPATKFRQNIAGTQSFAAAGAITLLNGITTGSGYATRNGSRINMRSLYISGRVECLGLEQTCQMFVIYDKQPNGALPQIGDILNNQTDFALPNIHNRDRFQILYHKSVHLNSKVSGVGSQQMLRKYMKFNLPTLYDAGVVGDITDISRGALYFATVGPTLVPADSAKIEYEYRLRFSE